MTVFHEDVAIGRNQHVARSVEHILSFALDTLLPEREQDFSLRAELDDDVLRRVGHPHIPALVHVHSVRVGEDTAAEALDLFASLIKGDDRIFCPTLAGVVRWLPASIGDPDYAFGRNDAGPETAVRSAIAFVTPALPRAVRIGLRIRNGVRLRAGGRCCEGDTHQETEKPFHN